MHSGGRCIQEGLIAPGVFPSHEAARELLETHDASVASRNPMSSMLQPRAAPRQFTHWMCI